MFRRLLGVVAIIVLLALIGSSWRQASAQAQTEQKPFFTRLIGPQTLVFQHCCVADLMNTPVVEELIKQMPDMKERLFKGFEKELGMAVSDLETLTLYLNQPRVGGGEFEEPRPPYFLLRSKKPFDAAAVKSSVGENGKTIQFGKYSLTTGSQRGVSLLDDRTALIIAFNNQFSAENAQKELLTLYAALDTSVQIPDGLKPAVEAASNTKHLTVTGFVISKELSELMQEQLKNLPPMMSPFKPLAPIQSGVLTVDYVKGAEKDLQVKLLGRYADAGSATAAQNALRFAVGAGKMAITSLPNRNDPDMKSMYDFLGKQLDQVKLETSDKDLVVNYQINLGTVMPMLTTATERVRKAADFMVSANNMRQCIIAMHNYHNDFAKMPEAATLKNGKPMHSWRVMMLPYLEHDNIYKQVRLDEPWDSESNKKLFESIPMPKVYAHPTKTDSDNKTTFYKVFVSKSDINPRAGFSLGKPITLGQMSVQDGTSNTMAMIEAGPPVLWYKPEDIEFDPKAQLPNLVSPWKDKKVNIGFFDGSIRTGWLGTDEETWKGFITINGGEQVDFSKIEERK